MDLREDDGAEERHAKREKKILGFLEDKRYRGIDRKQGFKFDLQRTYDLLVEPEHMSEKEKTKATKLLALNGDCKATKKEDQLVLGFR